MVLVICQADVSLSKISLSKMYLKLSGSLYIVIFRVSV